MSNSYSHGKPRRAFSLVLVLALLALTLAGLFSILNFSRSQNAETALHHARHQARSAALSAARIALGELQLYAGADHCATAPIPGDANPHWTGVWRGARVLKEFSECAPLVSNHGIFTKTRPCKFSSLTKFKNPIEVPWEQLDANTRFAYFVIDESQFASIAKRERQSYLDAFQGKKDGTERLVRLRQQTPRRSTPEYLLGEIDPDSEKFRQALDAAPDEKILLSSLLEARPRPQKQKILAGLTLNALAVPADWKHNRLKLDLSVPENLKKLSAQLPPEAAEIFAETNTSPEEHGVPVAVTPPSPAGALGYFDHPFPFLTELKLHLGFFNPRSDGQHRARFHVTTRLWNPYAFPLLAHADGQLGMFDVENLPTIVITNQNTGGEILFSPSDFPVGRFGLVRQTPSDKTCNAYCRIFDTSAQNPGGEHGETGLHGGEVFLARFPDPKGQANGLARNLGGPSWKFQKDPSKADKAPSGAQPHAWFHDTHKITIESIPSLFPANFFVRGYAGTLSQQTSPDDYSAPVIALKNVPLPMFFAEISGQDYNRQLAGDYDITQANLVWKIRLRLEDSKAMEDLFNTMDPRSGIFDFEIPAVKRAFEISALTGADACREAELGGDAESPTRNPFPLRDKFPNEHATHIPNAFSSIRIFDTPHFPVASVGALRHLAFNAVPMRCGFGMPPGKRRTHSLNAILDSAYFSSPKHNPHSISCEKHYLISGAFNLNSENADAWASVLTSNVPATSGTLIHEDLKSAFFTHPFSAHIHFPGQPVKIMSDDRLETLSAPLREIALMGQSVRELRQSSLRNFSEAIVHLLKARRERGDLPFESIEEFADSGILRQAIQESGINTIAGKEIPSWVPTTISQEAILESFAPTATPRGDTFTILCRAEVFHPLTKKMLSSACAELKAQRVPDFFDASQPADTPADSQNTLNRAFGRRFKIRSFRWLSHDEL